MAKEKDRCTWVLDNVIVTHRINQPWSHPTSGHLVMWENKTDLLFKPLLVRFLLLVARSILTAIEPDISALLSVTSQLLCSPSFAVTSLSCALSPNMSHSFWPLPFLPPPFCLLRMPFPTYPLKPCDLVILVPLGYPSQHSQLGWMTLLYASSSPFTTPNIRVSVPPELWGLWGGRG